MAYFEKDHHEVQMVSETCDEVKDSKFRRIESTKHEASSISIHIYEENSSLHSDVDATKASTTQKGNIDFPDGMHKHLKRSGKLGMCHDPNCTTCPTYLKPSQPKTTTSSTSFDHKIHKCLQFLNNLLHGVMNPHAYAVQLWKRICAISCLVEIFFDPLFFYSIYVKKDDLCIDINWTIGTSLIVYRSTFDLVYFLHILLQFRMAYFARKSGVLVDNPKKIIFKYVKSYFIIDLFVVSPLPQTLMIVLPTYVRSDGANYSRLLGAGICVQYLCRLIRFLQIERSTTGFVHTWAKDIKNLLLFMLFGHLVGSCWYLFGIQRVNKCFQNACNNSNIAGCSTFIGCSSTKKSDLWTNNLNAIACLNPTSSGDFLYGIYEDAVPLTTEKKLLKKYVYALFWGFQQVLSLADNLKPTYNLALEVCFVMSIMALGLVFYALLIGNIQAFLLTLRQRRLEKEVRCRDVEQWMSHRRMPEDLRKRIKMAEGYNWAVTKGVNEEMLLENLPEDLQTDIRRHLFKFVKKDGIFGVMEEHIFDAVCERLKKKTYIKRSRILSEGDIIKKMVFIVRGKLESIGQDGKKVLLSDGDVFGEELLTWYLERAFPNKDGEKERSNISRRTIRCITNVEAFSLRLADLEDLTTLFPEFLQNPRVQKEQ